MKYEIGDIVAYSFPKGNYLVHYLIESYNDIYYECLNLNNGKYIKYLIKNMEELCEKIA